MNAYLSRWLLYYPATYLRGEHIIPRLNELMKSQWESPEGLEIVQTQRLRAIVEHARSHSPMYASRLSHIEPGEIDKPSMQTVPTIEKNDIREHYESFVTNIRGRSDVKTTGGSTGSTVTLKKDRRALAWERAVTWRGYTWAGLSVASSQARFWGVPRGGGKQLASRAVDLVANRIRLSAFGVTDGELEDYHARIMRYQPEFMYGYVSFLAKFARFVQHHGKSMPKSLRCTVCTAEILDQESRDLLKSSFGVPVFNEYGCGEVGSIAHECEAGQLHINAETLLVEIDQPNSSGVGELVVTDLFNRALPLIRYRLGDYGRLAHERCACGRGLPVLRNIFGRAYDAIIGTNGQWHHPESVMYIFQDLKDRGALFHGFQVIQNGHANLEVRLVAEPAEIEKWEGELRAMIRRSLSDEFEVDICCVERIPREQSGKMRLVKRMYEESG